MEIRKRSSTRKKERGGKKVTRKKKGRIVVRRVEGRGKIATVERGNISERLSIAAFYAN